MLFHHFLTVQYAPVGLKLTLHRLNFKNLAFEGECDDRYPRLMYEQTDAYITSANVLQTDH